MTKLAIIIPTYKQKFLFKTLEGLSNQEFKDFEVIIVENGVALDSTRKLCLAFNKALKLKYIYEKTAGANRARNIGIKNCNSELIGLIDDDCIPSQNWTKNIIELHSNYLDAGIIGGKVILKFLHPKPNWLEGIFKSYLAELDWGEYNRNIEEYEYLVGANFSFKRDVFLINGGFDEEVGLKYDNLLANDELDFITNTRKLGKEIIFSPEIFVTHLIPKERTSLQYLLSKSYYQGKADAILLRKDNQNFDEIDATSFLDTIILEDEIEISHIKEMKVKIGVSSFVKYFENFIKSKTFYYNGLVDELKSNKGYYLESVLNYSNMDYMYQKKINNIKKIGSC